MKKINAYLRGIGVNVNQSLDLRGGIMDKRYILRVSDYFQKEFNISTTNTINVTPE
jgi:hypothetical protein